MTEIKETKLKRDHLQGVIPFQSYNDKTGEFDVLATDGTVVEDVNFGQTKLLRDRIQGVIPFQMWDKEQGKFVIVEPSNNGQITTISATNVIETPVRRFVTGDEKAQVTATAEEVGSHSERIMELENELQSIPTTDEKVKMTSAGVAGYLIDFVDGKTIQVLGGKFVLKSLDGLDIPIDILNLLQGLTGPVQAQIDALSNLNDVRDIVDAETDLPVVVAEDGITILVRSDSTQDGASTFYRSNGVSWVYVNKIDSGLTRDFTTNPINLSSETTGPLPKSRYEKQNAAETTITDSGNLFTATTVEDALAELFTYANSGKLSIANAIGISSDTFTNMAINIQQLKNDFANFMSNKGIPTSPSSQLKEMINKIPLISNITLAGTVKSTSKLNVVAPYSHQIVLNEPLKKEDIATSVLQHIPGTSGLVRYTANYNNGDAGSFIFDPNEIVFENGFMTIKDSWEYALTQIGTDDWESDEIDFAQFVSVGADAIIDVDALKVTIKALKTTAAIAKASGDISITGVESLDQYIAIVLASGNGKVKKAFSFDSGLTWWAYDGTQWASINVDSKSDFGSKGTDITIVNTLTNTELSVIRNNSNFVRHADYIERPTYDDIAKNDSLQLKVTMVGTNELVNVPYTYDEATKTLTHNFTQSGTFTINYVDAAS